MKRDAAVEKPLVDWAIKFLDGEANTGDQVDSNRKKLQLTAGFALVQHLRSMQRLSSTPGDYASGPVRALKSAKVLGDDFWLRNTPDGRASEGYIPLPAPFRNPSRRAGGLSIPVQPG